MSKDKIYSVSYPGLEPVRIRIPASRIEIARSSHANLEELRDRSQKAIIVQFKKAFEKHYGLKVESRLEWDKLDMQFKCWARDEPRQSQSKNVWHCFCTCDYCLSGQHCRQRPQCEM